jgi:tRNA dimethylallyltransferase
MVAVLGATATGKSRLGIQIAQLLDGEIVNCDSTAVYRQFDIGTDKVPVEDRSGIPHHLIDIIDPTEAYSAARYAQDAACTIRAITSRGRMPIVVGGTGLYFRALTRGLFPGPARNETLRARLERVAERRGTPFLHRAVSRIDPRSGRRIQPNDRKRLIRALEVYLLTGRALSDHFAETVSPIGEYDVIALALHLPAEQIAGRVTRRVDEQFARGVVDEVRGILAGGVPATAHPFTGLVYRQVLELLAGVRNEAETRALIVRENRNYARRQLIWFRKEPNLHWLHGPGEQAAARDAALDVLHARGIRI